jgi:hypothetical protein
MPAMTRSDEQITRRLEALRACDDPSAREYPPAVLCLLLLLAPAELLAENPWSYELPPEREQQQLDEAIADQALSDQDRTLLAAAIADGLLLATATCVSSGTVEELTPGGSVKHWIGDVENVATVLVSNLSDHPVWLVDVTISPASELDGLPRPKGQPLGTWTANLPFIPPHSQARILMGCNTLSAIGGGSVDKLDAEGTAGIMTAALARELATTPTRFYRDAGWDKTVTERPPEARSLASYALPFVDDRETARLLLAAIRKHGDEYQEGDELLDRTAPWRLGQDLARASLATAHGIVDVLEHDPPEQLTVMLREAIDQRSGDNDEALLRLVASVCARAEPELIDDLLITELKSKRPREWLQGVIAACPLAPERTVAVVEQLAIDAAGKSPTRPSSLTRFISLMPSPNFEIALSMLLGTDPSQLDARPAGEAATVIDGGERAAVLWIAMATLPPPERLAALEAWVRTQDAAEMLILLIPWQMNADHFALFDRVAARLAELPATARGDAIEPVLRAGLDSPWLERGLLDRLFALAEHDRARLRPIALQALAKNQSMFTSEAIAALPHEHGVLLDLFEGPLADCNQRERMQACHAVLAGDPELLRAAQTGLSPEFRAKLTASLVLADPSDEQRELLRLYLPLGVDVDPIARAICEQGMNRAAFEGEVDEHVAFLDEFAPTHPCTLELHDQLGAGARLRNLLIGIGLGVLALVGLGVWRSRRRQRALLDENG